MKPSRLLMIAALAMPLIISSCGSRKKVVEETQPVVVKPTQETSFLQQINDSSRYDQFVTSKVRFTVDVGQQSVTLTGNLRMKRDDVIRLQLMAFGFVEAARIEFTREYVLVMDRINKQYMKAFYGEVDFLRNSGLNFYSLQALFWGELFMPNKSVITDSDMKDFDVSLGDEDGVVSYDKKPMSYKWLVGKKDSRVSMANVSYDGTETETQLTWDYLDFQPLKNTLDKMFPTDMSVTLNSLNKKTHIASKEVKMRIKLNYLNNESEWEPRTQISAKYREVSVDEILARFMSI
jgi:hypothetical protein